MELGCQQVDFFKLGHSLSECTEFIGRHYLLIQLITVKGFRHFTIKKKLLFSGASHLFPLD